MEKRGRPAKAEKVEVVGEGEKAELVKQKRKPTVKDKVEGALEKVVGAVERRPGKKVRRKFLFLFFSGPLFGGGGAPSRCLWWGLERGPR